MKQASSYLKEFRDTIRGYTELQETQRLGLVRELKNELAKTRLSRPNKLFGTLLFGAANQYSEVAVRQYLLSRLRGDFDREIIRSVGNQDRLVTTPLPRSWRKILLRNGVRCEGGIRAWARWNTFIYNCLVEGIRNAGTAIRNSLADILRRRIQKENRNGGAYFFFLARENLPVSNKDEESYDLLSWYCQWEGRDHSITAIYHSVPEFPPVERNGIRIEYKPFDLFRLKGWKELIYFLFWTAIIVPMVIIATVLGRWSYAVLLGECSHAKMVRINDSCTLAGEYLFHFSSAIFRPLWTYEAELKGARITCYFYTTYDQPELADGPVEQAYEFGALTWPRFLLWDQTQAEILLADSPFPARKDIVGPVWFSDSSLSLPRLPLRSIAVFDVEKHRLAAHFAVSTLAEYYDAVPAVNLRFLSDLVQIAEENDYTVIFKRKRNIGNRAMPSYERLLEKLKNQNNFIMVPPEISAIRVIRRCQATVSMPFTATAFFAEYYDKPAAYYDPSDWIQKDDRAARTVPIISGKEELRSWVKGLAG